MLNMLRESISGPLAKIFIGLLVLSFAVWGIQDIFGNYGQRTIAKIDKITLTVENYIDEYNNQLSLISKNIGRQLSQEEAQLMGVDSDVLQKLIIEGLTSVEVESLKLGISENYLANKIISDATFYKDGKFNKEIYVQRIGYAGYNEETFLEELVKSEKKLQLYNIVSSGIKVPNIMLDSKKNYENNERVVEYFILPNKKFNIKTPSENDLKNYYENFQNNFSQEETRDVEILTLNEKSVKKFIEIKNEEIEASYKDNIKDYFVKEKREIYQFLFNNLAEAESIYKNSYKKGIKDLISESNYKTDDIFIGNITKDKVVDPIIADLAFSINQNSYSKPVKGSLGYSIIYIDNITKEQTLPLNNVKANIRETILSSKSDDKIDELYEMIEDARAAGESLPSIANSLSIDLENYRGMNSSGLDTNGNSFDELESADLLESLFSNYIDTDIDVVESKNSNRYTWLDIININPSYIKTFDSVRSELQKNIINEKETIQESLYVKEILEKIKSTKNINSIANELGVNVNVSLPFSRKNPSQIFSNDFIKIIFNSRINSTIAGKSSIDNKNIILTIKEEKQSSGKFDENTELLAIATLEQELNNDIFDNYVNGLQSKYDVSINQANLNKLFTINDEL